MYQSISDFRSNSIQEGTFVEKLQMALAISFITTNGAPGALFCVLLYFVEWPICKQNVSFWPQIFSLCVEGFEKCTVLIDKCTKAINKNCSERFCLLCWAEASKHYKLLLKAVTLWGRAGLIDTRMLLMLKAIRNNVSSLSAHWAKESQTGGSCLWSHSLTEPMNCLDPSNTHLRTISAHSPGHILHILIHCAIQSVYIVNVYIYYCIF